MTIKLITFTAVALSIVTSGAFAQDSDNMQQEKKKPAIASPATAASQYIHRPDSTQYHPGNGTAKDAPAAAKTQYKHKPDSTQYHPGMKKKKD